MRKSLVCLLVSCLTFNIPVSAQETILFPSDLVNSLRFGRSVAAHDDCIVVGTRGGSGGGLSEGVYVFRNDGVNWVEEARLSATDSIVGHCFGCSLAAYDNSILIGAPTDDENGYFSGAAYIFRKEGDNWVEEVKLTPADAIENQQCGTVALYENYALIGCSTDEINGQLSSGSAYIFQKEGDNWIEKTKLIPSDPTASTLFGLHVSLNEDYAFIGAPRAHDDNNVKTGAVYVFKRIGNEWIEQVKLTPNDGMASDGFSKAVAKGDTLFVGSSRAPGNDEYYKGAGYIFVREGENWIEIDKLTPDDSEEENKALKGWGYSGKYVALASSYSGNCAPVHLFQRNGANWQRTNVFTGLGQEDERYGHAVFITNDYLVVAAFHTYYYQGNDSIRTGAVYVYDLDMIVSETEVEPADNSITLFPNPSGEAITISQSTASPTAFDYIEIYDINGRLMQYFSGSDLALNSMHMTFDISGLVAGTYIIHCVSENSVFSKRFIKL